tara:strand:+ start:240 stop:404 length:165 start_codon:yes stop_codon:yes gene_type:complete
VTNRTTKLVVRFNQQQLRLLDNLKKEGEFGETYTEIIVNVFREYIKQPQDKRGA